MGFHSKRVLVVFSGQMVGLGQKKLPPSCYLATELLVAIETGEKTETAEEGIHLLVG